jgi:hypothetical protein
MAAGHVGQQLGQHLEAHNERPIVSPLKSALLLTLMKQAVSIGHAAAH